MAVSRRSLVLAAAGTVATAWAGEYAWSAHAAPAKRVVPVSAGPRRSVYLGWMTSLAQQVRRDYPELTFEVQVSSGSVENLQRLGQGRAALAVASTDVAALALGGRPPYTSSVPVTALARVYDDYMHLIVRDDSDLRSLQDLTGRRVAVGPPGSGTALMAQRLLQDRGVRVDAVPLDVVEAGLALQARGLAAVFWLGGLPTRAVTELADRVRIRLLPLTDAAARLRARYGAAYRSATIPASTYRPAEGVPTVASANLLLCRADAPAGLVNPVLRTAFRRRDAIAAAQPAGNALDTRVAIATVPIPLHAAAAGYYRAGKP